MDEDQIFNNNGLNTIIKTAIAMSGLRDILQCIVLLGVNFND